jgi:hypothetical protein
MTDVAITIDSYVANVFPDHEDSVKQLASAIRTKGYSVTVNSTPNQPLPSKEINPDRESRQGAGGVSAGAKRSLDLNEIARRGKEGQKTSGDLSIELPKHSARISEVTQDTFYGSLFEAIVIFIGSSVGGATMSQITGDIYGASKEWARNRFRKSQAVTGKTNERQPIFVKFEIRNSENQIVLTWIIDESGEHEKSRKETS